jgi:hypothetical protein
MDTEKVHSIQHCGIEITSLANPLNASAEGPEGGHKLWIKGQGANTNQGPEAARTMLQHSVNKEAAQLLCEAVQARAEDGDHDHDESDNWTDSHGASMRADRWWFKACPDLSQAGKPGSEPEDSHGPCLGIRVNIWERAKTRRHMLHFLVGGGDDQRGHDVLDHRRILRGDAGSLGQYDILAYLPDKVARFLYEFHDFRYCSLDSPPIPEDRTDFDVHGALEPTQAG